MARPRPMIPLSMERSSPAFPSGASLSSASFTRGKVMPVATACKSRAARSNGKFGAKNPKNDPAKANMRLTSMTLRYPKRLRIVAVIVITVATMMA